MPTLIQRIKARAADRAEKSALVQKVNLTGQAKFIQDVAEWENVSFEEAQAICHGETWPVQYEYTLGYKLSDPIWAIGISLQPGKKARERAIENFKKQLCAEELALFEQEVMDRCSFVEKMREEKRKHKELNKENLADNDDD